MYRLFFNSHDFWYLTLEFFSLTFTQNFSGPLKLFRNQLSVEIALTFHKLYDFSVRATRKTRLNALKPLAKLKTKRATEFRMTLKTAEHARKENENVRAAVCRVHNNNLQSFYKETRVL